METHLVGSQKACRFRQIHLFTGSFLCFKKMNGKHFFCVWKIYILIFVDVSAFLIMLKMEVQLAHCESVTFLAVIYIEWCYILYRCIYIYILLKKCMYIAENAGF